MFEFFIRHDALHSSAGWKRTLLEGAWGAHAARRIQSGNPRDTMAYGAGAYTAIGFGSRYSLTHFTAWAAPKLRRNIGRNSNALCSLRAVTELSCKKRALTDADYRSVSG
jgi:hypothetical protein